MDRRPRGGGDPAASRLPSWPLARSAAHQLPGRLSPPVFSASPPVQWKRVFHSTTMSGLQHRVAFSFAGDLRRVGQGERSGRRRDWHPPATSPMQRSHLDYGMTLSLTKLLQIGLLRERSRFRHGVPCKVSRPAWCCDNHLFFWDCLLHHSFSSLSFSSFSSFMSLFSVSSSFFFS